MRTLFAPLRAATFAVALLFLTACNTVSVNTTQALGVPASPPNPNPAGIQILSVPPTRPHIWLGEIQAQPSSSSTDAAKITQSLQDAAAKLGADAVVIVYDRIQVTGAVVMGPWWGHSVDTVQGRVIIGVPIKYQP